MDIVLRQERRKYVKRVLLRAVDPLDWAACRNLTEHILRDPDVCWAEEFQDCPASQFAGEWPSLLQACLEAESLRPSEMRLG
jgi:hypothetical protein